MVRQYCGQSTAPRGEEVTWVASGILLAALSLSFYFLYYLDAVEKRVQRQVGHWRIPSFATSGQSHTSRRSSTIVATSQ